MTQEDILGEQMGRFADVLRHSINEGKAFVIEISGKGVVADGEKARGIEGDLKIRVYSENAAQDNEIDLAGLRKMPKQTPEPCNFERKQETKQERDARMRGEKDSFIAGQTIKLVERGTMRLNEAHQTAKEMYNLFRDAIHNPVHFWRHF